MIVPGFSKSIAVIASAVLLFSGTVISFGQTTGIASKAPVFNQNLHHSRKGNLSDACSGKDQARGGS